MNIIGSKWEAVDSLVRTACDEQTGGHLFVCSCFEDEVAAEIARLHNLEVDPDYATKEAGANARLIAVAQDLFQSLRGLIGTCEMQGVDYDQPDMQAARAAIAKATGEKHA